MKNSDPIIHLLFRYCILQFKYPKVLGRSYSVAQLASSNVANITVAYVDWAIVLSTKQLSVQLQETGEHVLHNCSI